MLLAADYDRSHIRHQDMSILYNIQYNNRRFPSTIYNNIVYLVSETVTGRSPGVCSARMVLEIGVHSAQFPVNAHPYQLFSTIVSYAQSEFAYNTSDVIISNRIFDLRIPVTKNYRIIVISRHGGF